MALYFPREALQGSISEARVYVVFDGKAVLRNITIGRENDKSLEALTGLKEGDEVITSGMVNLSDGKAVRSCTRQLGNINRYLLIQEFDI